LLTCRYSPGTPAGLRERYVSLRGNTGRFVAALIAIKPGRRPRLIYRVHENRRRRNDKRKGFTETDFARLLDAAHQQLGGPIVLVWDNLNAHVSAAMAELVAARAWLTVYQLPPYAHELNPVEMGLPQCGFRRACLA
jgi:putative transposase